MATNFKEGDIVTVISECTGSVLGREYKLGKDTNGNLDLIIKVDTNGCVTRGCSCPEKWQLVKDKLTKNNIMNKLKTLFTRLVDPSVAKLSEVGFLNGDLALTNEAKDELMNILFLEKKVELVKLADEILEERKNGFPVKCA